MPQGFNELNLAAVRNNFVKDFSHHKNGIPFPPSLLGHQIEMGQPFPVVHVVETAYATRESSLNSFQHLDLCKLCRIP